MSSSIHHWCLVYVSGIPSSSLALSAVMGRAVTVGTKLAVSSEGEDSMNNYHSSIYAQARAVDRKLRLPDLLPYEKRSLLGRKLGLQAQVMASPSMRADLKRREMQRKQQAIWG